ncbi:MAG: hypothetical protein M5U09_08740 [Gammaproteobacteria bacterium]|nr:hypothetical protein [Gammaproteobacteria bacterium]
MAGRYRVFASLVLAAALFKLTPLLLLALLALAPKPREALRQAIAPVLGFIVLIVLSLYLEPAWVRSLGEDVGRNVALAAPLNQSYYSTGEDPARRYRRKAGILGSGNVHGARGGGGGTHRRVARRAVRSDHGHDVNIRVVFLVVLAYMLVLPRLQDYQMAMAIVPCFYLIFNSRLPAAPLLFLFVVVRAVNIRLPGMIEFYRTFFNFKLLLIVYAAWILLALELWRGTAERRAGGAGGGR